MIPLSVVTISGGMNFFLYEVAVYALPLRVGM